MKKLIILLIIFLVSCALRAQNFPVVDSVKKYINDSIVPNRPLKATSIQKAYNGVARFLPDSKQDTADVLVKVHGFFVFQRKDSALYVWDTITAPKRWRKVSASGGAGSDPLKLNTADTSTMLAPYLRKIDTLNKWVNNITINATNDSIIYYVGNIRKAEKIPATGGASYTFDPGLKVDNSVVSIDNKRPVVMINETFDGGSLPTGWTAVGSPTVTYSGGSANFSGFPNNNTTYIRTNIGTMTENAEIEASIVYNSISANDYGLSIGWQSYNPNGYTHNVWGRYVSDASNGNVGKTLIYGSTGNSSNYSDSTKSITAGDRLLVKMRRLALMYKLTVINLTQGWTIYKEVQTTPAGAPFTAHNSAYLTIYHHGGDISVESFKYTIYCPIITDLFIWGDSIVFGQGATEETRWANNVGIRANNIVSGGGADDTRAISARLTEMKLVRPARAAMVLGGNDILFSVPVATIRTNLLQWRDSCIAWGIEPVWIYPTPRTATDLTNLVTLLDTMKAIQADFKVRGTWDNLRSGTTLLTQFNSDGTHPNEAGHSMAAYSLNVRLKFPNAAAINNQNTASQISARFWINGIGVSDSSFRGRTTGAHDGHNTGGIVFFGSGSSTSYGSFGYDVSTNCSWWNSLTPGVAYRNNAVGTAGDVNFGVGTLSPTSKLHVWTTAAGNNTAIRVNHQGSFSSQNQKMNMIVGQNANSDRVSVSMYVGAGSQLGMKLYTTNSTTMNTDPSITMTGDRKTGIGLVETEDPLNTLDVNGEVRVRTVTHASASHDSIFVKEGGVLKYRTKAEIQNDIAPPVQTYTPTLSNTTNIAASTAYTTYYLRNGDWVTVWGEVDIDATTAATISELGFSLPVTSSIANTYALSGTASHEDGTIVQVAGDVSNGRAKLRFKPITDTNNKYSIQFTYKYTAP